MLLVILELCLGQIISYCEQKASHMQVVIKKGKLLCTVYERDAYFIRRYGQE